MSDTNKRCKFISPADGKWHCGSHAFNLARNGIKQGNFCDVHYWQSRCEKAESSPIAQPVPPSADGPAELWLQLHGDCLDHELRIPVDYTTGEITWCWHSINDSDVRYVRADLSQPVQPAEKLECTRSHPHENMDALCELRTVIARLENEKAQKPAAVGAVEREYYYYKVDGCTAINSDAPDCICWHKEGTGPLSGTDAQPTTWRAAIASKGAL